MVVDNETGFLVPPSDWVALAGAIEKIIVDLPLARRFGEKGRRRAEELFSLEKNARELVTLIEQVSL